MKKNILEVEINEKSKNEIHIHFTEKEGKRTKEVVDVYNDSLKREGSKIGYEASGDQHIRDIMKIVNLDVLKKMQELNITSKELFILFSSILERLTIVSSKFQRSIALLADMEPIIEAIRNRMEMGADEESNNILEETIKNIDKKLGI